MTSLEIARIYTDLVTLYDAIPEEESVSMEEVAMIRSKYHSLLMDQFRADGIGFADRFEARDKAFEMIRNAEDGDA